MTTDKERRDRISYLRELAVTSLKRYSGGFDELRRVDQDLNSIIASLQEVADAAWTNSLLKKWGKLEIIYALRLSEGRNSLTDEEETDVRGIVSELLAELQSYQLALTADDKPEEGDIVRLRRSLPEQNLSAGSTGTIAVDYSKYSGSDDPLEYEVEFASHDGTDKVLTTLTADDLTIVSRPRFS